MNDNTNKESNVPDAISKKTSDIAVDVIKSLFDSYERTIEAQKDSLKFAHEVIAMRDAEIARLTKQLASATDTLIAAATAEEQGPWVITGWGAKFARAYGEGLTDSVFEAVKYSHKAAAKHALLDMTENEPDVLDIRVVTEAEAIRIEKERARD